MIIDYDKDSQLIEINDQYDKKYKYDVIVIIYIGLIALSGIIEFWIGSLNLFEALFYGLCLIFFPIMTYRFFTKVSKKIIYQPSEVKALVRKKRFWGNKCYLELTDGKTRPLKTLTYIGNIEDTKALFNELGIPILEPKSLLSFTPKNVH